MLNCCSKICPPSGQDSRPDNVLGVYFTVSGTMCAVRSHPRFPRAKLENGDDRLVWVSGSRCLVFVAFSPPLLCPVLVSLPPRWMLSGSLMMPVSPHWLWLQQQFTCRAEDRRAVKLTSLFMLERCVIIPT